MYEFRNFISYDREECGIDVKPSSLQLHIKAPIIKIDQIPLMYLTHIIWQIGLNRKTVHLPTVPPFNWITSAYFWRKQWRLRDHIRDDIYILLLDKCFGPWEMAEANFIYFIYRIFYRQGKYVTVPKHRWIVAQIVY